MYNRISNCFYILGKINSVIAVPEICHCQYNLTNSVCKFLTTLFNYAKTLFNRKTTTILNSYILKPVYIAHRSILPHLLLFYSSTIENIIKVMNSILILITWYLIRCRSIVTNNITLANKFFSAKVINYDLN